MQETPIGKVIHYYDKANVAVIKLTKNDISIGDKIKFVHDNTEFVQTIDSMEINHEKVNEVKQGNEVAIKLNQKGHDKGLIYKIEE